MTTHPPLLLLWDIDGTLIVSGGAGMRALSAALQSTFGIQHNLADIDYAGRTDKWILGQIFGKFNLPTDEPSVRRFLYRYLELLPQELSPATAYTLPGVETVIRGAHERPHVLQGLLTGNMRESAEVKMRFHGLWDYFKFGAFGNDHERRNDLGPLALQRAFAYSGVTYPASRIWIIGDTPHDIDCGRAIGAKTLAVGTGQHTVEQLGAHSPDRVMENLSDTAAFWRAIDS